MLLKIYPKVDFEVISKYLKVINTAQGDKLPRVV